MRWEVSWASLNDKEVGLRLLRKLFIPLRKKKNALQPWSGLRVKQIRPKRGTTWPGHRTIKHHVCARYSKLCWIVCFTTPPPFRFWVSLEVQPPVQWACDRPHCKGRAFERLCVWGAFFSERYFSLFCLFVCFVM